MTNLFNNFIMKRQTNPFDIIGSEKRFIDEEVGTIYQKWINKRDPKILDEIFTKTNNLEEPFSSDFNMITDGKTLYYSFDIFYKGDWLRTYDLEMEVGERHLELV